MNGLDANLFIANAGADSHGRACGDKRLQPTARHAENCRRRS